MLGFTFDVFISIKVYPWVVRIPVHCGRSSVPFSNIKFNNLPIPILKHYLDDFRFIADSFSSCAKLLHEFTLMCSILGVPLAPEKTQGPVQSIQCLFEIDSVNAQVRIPYSKVQVCQRIHNLLSKPKTTLVRLWLFNLDRVP